MKANWPRTVAIWNYHITALFSILLWERSLSEPEYGLTETLEICTYITDFDLNSFIEVKL
jgi:hypothetical protein